MKFRFKLFICMVGLLSVLLGVGSALLITLSFQDSLERQETEAYDSYKTVLAIMQLTSVGTDYEMTPETFRLLEQLQAQNSGGWEALTILKDGTNVYDYVVAEVDLQDVLSAAASVEAPPIGQCVYWYDIENGSIPVLVWKGMVAAPTGQFTITLVRDTSTMFEVRSDELRIFAYVFILMVVLCATISYLIARMLTRPLARLSDTAREIADGNLDSRTDITTTDEIGSLAREFDRMADIQEHNILQLEEASEKQKRFTGNFAHEIKTPMTSIIGYAELLNTGMLDEEETSEAAGFILSEGKRLERLSHTLLDLIVLEESEVELKPEDPTKIIEELAEKNRPIYKRDGIRLEVEGEEGECMIEPDLLVSLILNVWDNARKAMTKDAYVEEGCSKAEKPTLGKHAHPELEIFTEITMLEDGCRITVDDTGCGMSEETLSHITEEFYRADPSRNRASGGAGIGLALVQRIIALHDGSFQAESEPGHGTRIIIELHGGRA